MACWTFQILWNFWLAIWLYFVFSYWLWVSLDKKILIGVPLNARGQQGSILGPTLFLLYINDFPDDIICNTANYAYDTTL